MSSDKLLLRAIGLSKVYTGTLHPIATLKHALFGTANDKTDEYPVLDDVSIEVRQGEAVGIMGRNGAGKSTLLGMLGNVIEPTTGTIERMGKFATLLGMTAGFNPNFTGRENAYLFCSIQGLNRKQTDARIDDVEDFAELGRYFDLPLRTYSSGMQSRLAFACAVNVSADLMIIDETLSVGDANFRMKCYTRIKQMKDDGQSFLLVSHSQNLVANFCSRGIVLEGGKKIFDGPTFDAIEVYKRVRTEAMGDSDLTGKVTKTKQGQNGLDNEVTLENFKLSERIINGIPYGVISAKVVAHKDKKNITFNFGVMNHLGITVSAWDGEKAGLTIPELKAKEKKDIEMLFAKRLLAGRYFISCSVSELVGDVAKPQSIYLHFMSFEVINTSASTGIADLDMRVTIAA